MKGVLRCLPCLLPLAKLAELAVGLAWPCLRCLALPCLALSCLAWARLTWPRLDLPCLLLPVALSGLVLPCRLTMPFLAYFFALYCLALPYFALHCLAVALVCLVFFLCVPSRR